MKGSRLKNIYKLYIRNPSTDEWIGSGEYKNLNDIAKKISRCYLTAYNIYHKKSAKLCSVYKITKP
jgi:hypothetical protein